MPLIDSGIALYIWSVARFASVVIYTCKAFDPAVAVESTRSFFAMTAVESRSF